MGGTRKIAAILVTDVVGYSWLAGTDEDRTLARLRGLRSDLIDPAITLLSVARQRRRRNATPEACPQLSCSAVSSASLSSRSR
jgi:class 3 adenylate cyclase